MARLKSNKAAGDSLVVLNQRLAAMASPASTTMGSISTESIAVVTEGKEAGNLFTNEYSELQTSLEGIFTEVLGSGKVTGTAEKLGFGKGAVSEASLEAASIMAIALGNPQAYRKAAMKTDVISEEGVTVIGAPANSAYGYTTEPTASLEAFDSRALENLRGYNLLFAFSAALQDEFGEAFFRTVTLAPDNAGLEVSIRRTMVMQEQRHAQTGEFIKWDQRNLLDAVTDPSILMDESTKIYPRVIVGDVKSEANFADSAIVAPAPALAQGGTQILTAPLRPGKTISLIGISQNERIPGQSDQTDSLDHDVKVTKVYFNVTSAGGTSTVAFDTRSFAFNNFLKSNQGRDRRITLDFETNDLIVTGTTEDIAGAPAAALSFLAAAPYDNVVVKLGATITGHGDLQFGTINVQSSELYVAEARIVNADGTYEKITDQVTLDALTAAITGSEFVGYEVDARRSNLNRRQLGLLIDSVEERVRYMVPLSAPISLQTPITDTATAADLAAPLNAQRLRNSINAVTKLLEVRDVLRNVTAHVGYGSPTDAAPQVEGFARLMVRPVLYEDVINVANVISSPTSVDRNQNLQAAIVNKVRYGLTHAYTESRLQPVIDSLNGSAGERPHAVIGTDPTIAAYLAVQGDPRTIIGFESKVVVSYDVRMRNKIAASFVRPNISDADIASFGVMAYIPELVTNAMIPYNGANTQVTQVQSRTLHVCLLPVLVWLEVEGLEQAASGRVGLPVDFE